MQTKRSLLIITPYFAPQSHAAVFRAYKLAKYLARKNWRVHVLTVDKNYLYNEEQELLTALPPDVKIHQARYVEPTIRGLRMFCGGKDRSFGALKHAGSVVPALAPPAPSLLSRAYRVLREKINSPDVYWTWKRSALRAAGAIIREHEIDVIMTSSLPYTTIEIGRELKGKYNVCWIADFRDPMSYERRLHSGRARVFSKQKAIEQLAVDHADAITCLSSAHPLILADTYGVDRTRHVHFIPTGLDFDFAPAKAPAHSNRPSNLIFVGEYLPQYGDEFFKAFNTALKDPQVAALNPRFTVVGHAEINQARIHPLIKDLPMQSRVDFVDHLPQPKVYEMIREARAAVLCTSRVYPWWAGFAKMTDFISLRKPVVAIVPDPSEARKWLQLTGLGIFLDGTPDECARRLKDFLLAPASQDPAGVEEHCRRFRVDFQVEEFEKVFTDCLKRKSAGP